MAEIGIRELKQQASDIIRRVKEDKEDKETITITRRGKAVAKLVPIEGMTTEAEAVWAEMDELARDISRHWPEGVSAVDAVSEQRR